MTVELDYISRKKPIYPIQGFLRNYLKKNSRTEELPISYEDLMQYEHAFPVTDNDGSDTLWESVMYSQGDIEHINKSLCYIYSLLKTGGDMIILHHLSVSRIDFCTFGNSQPFRIRIVNNFNDNYDYFYVKQADASRVYGLELEHILSPNRINFFVHKKTLIEEHIAGVPGDQFINTYLNLPNCNKVRVAKEFVKFNERCFVKLLGDMRSYNYVWDITPDFENEQYRIRAIDFDQQCYEGKRTLYLPQFFKENNKMVNLCMELLNEDTVRQYQYEERTLMARRVIGGRYRLKDLIDCLMQDEISSQEKVDLLKKELEFHHEDSRFSKCKNMGSVLKEHLKVTLLKPKEILNRARL